MVLNLASRWTLSACETLICQRRAYHGLFQHICMALCTIDDHQYACLCLVLSSLTGAGHNNMECYPEYTFRLREFLDHVEACQMNKTVVLEEDVDSPRPHNDADPSSPEADCTGHNALCIGIGSIFAKLRLIQDQEAPKSMKITPRGTPSASASRSNDSMLRT